MVVSPLAAGRGFMGYRLHELVCSEKYKSIWTHYESDFLKLERLEVWHLENFIVRRAPEGRSYPGHVCGASRDLRMQGPSQSGQVWASSGNQRQ